MKSTTQTRGRQNRRSGYWAEFLARCYYRLTGWQILYKNYHTRRGTKTGEVDFIALRGKNIAFVEVKKRQTIDLAACAVLPRQQKRITATAHYFLKSHSRFKDYSIQFDAVLVKLPLTIRRIPNAWIENLD